MEHRCPWLRCTLIGGRERLQVDTSLALLCPPYIISYTSQLFFLGALFSGSFGGAHGSGWLCSDRSVDSLGGV